MRLSSRTTCLRRSCNSAESSIVTNRSSAGMNGERALSIVVLPEPVPPLIMTLIRPSMAAASTATISGQIEPWACNCSMSSGLRPKRRMESVGPFKASGGITALMREPSARRASTIGDWLSIRRPTRLTTRWMICIRCSSSAKTVLVSYSRPCRST